MKPLEVVGNLRKKRNLNFTQDFMKMYLCILAIRAEVKTVPRT